MLDFNNNSNFWPFRLFRTFRTFYSNICWILDFDQKKKKKKTEKHFHAANKWRVNAPWFINLLKCLKRKIWLLVDSSQQITVKPELTPTSKKRPPAYHAHHFGVPFSLLIAQNYLWTTTTNFGSRGWSLYTSLNVYVFMLKN